MDYMICTICRFDCNNNKNTINNNSMAKKDPLPYFYLIFVNALLYFSKACSGF